MFGLGLTTKIYVAVEAVDMRKGFEGLYGLVRDQLRQRRIQQLGPKSETLRDLQLKLLAEEEPGATREEVEAESRREVLTRTTPRENKPHPGRRKLPENLPRVAEVIACQNTSCAHCGEETSVTGYDESEQLDIEPARYLARVTKREKRACRRCSTVSAAPLAERILDKGVASNAVVVHTVVAKYCDHLPLYRQAVMLEREAGVQIGRATLDGWGMRVGELLQPVVEAMRRDLLTASYLQADETPVPVQRKGCEALRFAQLKDKMHDGRGENRQAYLRQYGKPGGETVFDFCLGRGREVRASFSRIGKGFYKPMAMRPTTISVGRSWCTWAAGRTRGASLSTR